MYLTVSLTPCEITFVALRAIYPERASPRDNRASTATTALKSFSHCLTASVVNPFFRDACIAPEGTYTDELHPARPCFSTWAGGRKCGEGPSSKGFARTGSTEDFSRP